MPRRFLFRLRVLAGVAFVLLGLDVMDGFRDSFMQTARAAWPVCVTLAVFPGWFGLEELWRAGRRTEAGALGALLFVGALHDLMFTPPPRWAQVLIVAIALYALPAAWRAVRTG